MAGNNRQRGKCYHFIRTGSCRFGDSCRFLHDSSEQPNPTSSHREPTPSLSPVEAEFRAWKFSAPTKRAVFLPSTAPTLDKFFQKALGFVNTDLAIRQETIKTLADEGGLQRIRQLIEQIGDASRKDSIFRDQVVPLFQTVTHEDVVVSATLERYVAEIAIFLYGPNGQRATKLFEFVCDALKSIYNANADAATAHSEQDVASCFAASLLALHQVVVMNGSAAINDNLRPYAIELCGLTEQWVSSGQDEFKSDVQEALWKTQHCLGLAAALPAATTQNRAVIPKAKFIIEQDPPGGRHDNDFIDISQIEILPTCAEILCPRQEYLPLIDLSQNHLQGVPGLLDRHFRLLREDAVGQLRLAVKAELEYLQGGTWRRDKCQQQGTKRYTYTNVCIEGFHPEQRAGFCFKVSFDQPARHTSDAERRDWWAHSKRLDPDALVCLVDSAGSASFCSVHENSKPRDRMNLKSNDSSQAHFSALYADRHRASVSLILKDTNFPSLRRILTAFRHPNKPAKLSLIEFPGILLAGFDPTLRALQQIKEAGDLPLANLLVPVEHGGSGFAEVPPPAYARKAGFRFNLRCLTKDGDTDIILKPHEPFDLPKFQSLTTLDQSQATALVESLCKELALIQGPPGTGKSFVGIELIKVLLANKTSRPRLTDATGAGIGPILVVCYTNHALDQLLEHLVAAGVEQIIRIGARSKSEVLEECNLRVVARNSTKTKHDTWCIAMQHKTLDETVPRLNHTLEMINKFGSVNSVKNHLSRNHPQHHSQLFGHTDDDGFTQQHQTNNVEFRRWLHSGEPAADVRPNRDLVKLPLRDLSQRERLNLYHHWVDEIIDSLSGRLESGLLDHRNHVKALSDLYSDFDLRCLRTANVVGVTCTGLAKNLQTLRKLNSKVLLCEEAGEVLEAHLLTAFLPSLQHIFLIGDHLQLMPQIENFDLSRESAHGTKHSLNVSLFERLVAPPKQMGHAVQPLPCTTLETQRRMHPSISDLVRQTLYPTLVDSPTVMEYPDVAGMRRRLYWFDHRHPEAHKNADDIDPTSHSNPFEIEMTRALVNHLVAQGCYRPRDIAVLTPYLGQLHLLRKELSKSFAIVLSDLDQAILDEAGLSAPNGPRTELGKTTLAKQLRIATVDNFQGEEAKVIVISLVRSNKEKKCGFLRTSNRINVLLSRAQHGMYIIGDSETAAAKVQMWADVLAMLAKDGNVGPKLELVCTRHPDTPIEVASPDDFNRFSPEGGCGLRCANRLLCGHACVQRCHSEVLHAAVYCREPCPRPMPNCDHACVKFCGDPCPENCPVYVFIPRRALPCGHIKEHLPCWMSQDVTQFRCEERVQRTVPDCEHLVSEACHVDVNDKSYICKAKCGVLLPCGHRCKQKCKDCRTRVENPPDIKIDHGKCQTTCGRPYATCRHACRSRCHGEEKCPPCDVKCEVRCSHSECPKKCSEPCQPCAEKRCVSVCPHSACTMPCSAPCNHIPCSRRCEEKLVCGHQCPSTCGERCPPKDFCHECGSDAVKETAVDFIEGLQYKELDLDKQPCIFPACGHFLTVESFDTQMSMEKYYEFDANGIITAIKSTLDPFSMDEIKTCSLCRGSLRDLNRYGRIVRRAMIDETMKKFISWSSKHYVAVAQKLVEETAKLAANISDVTKTQSDLGVTTLCIDGVPDKQIAKLRKARRYSSMLKLRSSLRTYLNAVKKEEQPFTKIFNFVEDARRRHGKQGALTFDGSLVQTKAEFEATTLLMRCDIAILADFLSRFAAAAPAGTAKIDITVDLVESREACLALLKKAEETKRPIQQVEALLFFALYSSLQIPFSPPAAAATLRSEAATSLSAAKDLCTQYPGSTAELVPEIENAETSLREQTYYAAVSQDEVRSVLNAISNAREYSGSTGHWYTCVNGHPFNIGNCGQANQQSVCPECGAQIGGRDHQMVEGVTRAEGLDNEFATLALGN